ncbi:MAG: hypothetical protein ACKO5K_12525, partial [Armatimonadota bacterium]
MESPLKGTIATCHEPAWGKSMVWSITADTRAEVQDLQRYVIDKLDSAFVDTIKANIVVLANNSYWDSESGAVKPTSLIAVVQNQVLWIPEKGAIVSGLQVGVERVYSEPHEDITAFGKSRF